MPLTALCCETGGFFFAKIFRNPLPIKIILLPLYCKEKETKTTLKPKTMETVTMHYTTFQVFEKKTGRPICTYTDTRSCLNEIFHGLDTVDESPLRTFERTYTVLREKFSKNSRFKEFRGKTVKFLQLNGEDFFYELNGELHQCSNYH